MAANNISQLTTSNTFQQWLIATQSLVATANLLTDGNGQTFYANTIFEIGGSNSSLNVVTGATVESLTNNVFTSNTSTIEILTSNVSNSNISTIVDLVVSNLATINTATFNVVNVGIIFNDYLNSAFDFANTVNIKTD